MISEFMPLLYVLTGVTVTLLVQKIERRGDQN